VLGNGRWYLGGHRLRQTHTGLVALCASRPFLEGHVRARVRALPNVRFLDACDILALATTPDGGRVTGTRVRRQADGGAEEVLDADLVVDATGRGSRSPLWLEALGYPRPPTEQVRIGLGYATRTYRLRPHALGGDLGVLHGCTPEHPRGGALTRTSRWPVFPLVRAYVGPPPESNRRPHPYHGTTGNRCAVRRFPRSRATVGAKVIGSLSAKLCALHPLQTAEPQQPGRP
jgi:hypothetical protein